MNLQNVPDRSDRGNFGISQNQGYAPSTPTFALGQGDAPALIAKLAEQLKDASNSFQKLAQIVGNPVATLGDSEQSQSVATSFYQRRATMKASNSGTAQHEMIAASAVAALLSIDARSFRRLRNDRKEQFPAEIRIGSSKRWRAREVHAWLDSRRPG